MVVGLIIFDQYFVVAERGLIKYGSRTRFVLMCSNCYLLRSTMSHTVDVRIYLRDVGLSAVYVDVSDSLDHVTCIAIPVETELQPRVAAEADNTNTS